MKKTMMAWSILLSTLNFKAQLPNNGFEELTSEGKISYWGSIFLLPVYVDSTGSHSDSIVFDNQLYFSTNDAHSGLRALEMRNAYNYTSSQQIAGSANLMSDSIGYSFVGTASVSQTPLYFSFYYKFLPAGSDTAYAFMEVFDYNGNSIGESSVELWAQKTNYTYVQKPVLYHSTDSAAFISVRFSTSKSGSPANFGTRFLVDDVNMLFTGITQNYRPENELRCFPNPVQNKLTVQLDKNLLGKTTDMDIADFSGKIIRQIHISEGEPEISMNTNDLKAGIYLLTLQINNQTYHAKFVK